MNRREPERRHAPGAALTGKCAPPEHGGAQRRPAPAEDREKAPHSTVKQILTRGFVLGFLSLLFSVAASYALLPTLPIYLARLGSTEAEIGLLVGIFGASSLVSRLVAGGILRRYSEKTVIMASSALFSLTFLACAVVQPFWPFFLVRLAQGFAFACLDTAALAFVVGVIPQAYRGQGIGYFLLGPSIALALAPSLAMVLISRCGFAPLFIVCAGLCLGALFFSCKAQGGQTPRQGKNTSEGNLFFDLKIVTPAVTSFLHNFVWGALTAFLPLYAVRRGVANPGHFFSAIAVMLVLGRSLGGKIADVFNREKIISIFIVVIMATMVMLVFSGSLFMFLLVGALWGTAAAFLVPASIAYALDYAGSSDGTTFGTMRAVMDLGLALGPIVMGAVVPITGYRLMFLSLAFICLVNLAYFLFWVKPSAVRMRKGEAQSLPFLSE